MPAYAHLWLGFAGGYAKASGLRHAIAELQRGDGGEDARNFEPVFALKALSYGRIDKIIRQLRKIYRDAPGHFEIPTFAVRIY